MIRKKERQLERDPRLQSNGGKSSAPGGGNVEQRGFAFELIVAEEEQAAGYFDPAPSAVSHRGLTRVILSDVM